MKLKFITTLAAVLSLGSVCFAQVEVIGPAEGIEVQFKRCISEGNVAYLDFLITNRTKSDVKAQPQASIRLYDMNYQTIAYDDEGNTYLSENYNGEMKIGTLTLSGISYPAGSFYQEVVLPVGISIKGRVEINGLDRFATSFQMVSIAFRGTMTENPYGQAMISFKNVPITRDE